MILLLLLLMCRAVHYYYYCAHIDLLFVVCRSLDGNNFAGPITSSITRLTRLKAMCATSVLLLCLYCCDVALLPCVVLSCPMFCSTKLCYRALCESTAASLAPLCTLLICTGIVLFCFHLVHAMLCCGYLVHNMLCCARCVQQPGQEQIFRTYTTIYETNECPHMDVHSPPPFSPCV